MSGFDREAEGAVVEFFEGLGGSVAGALGIDAHVHAVFKYCFHFTEAGFAAFITFAVNEDAAAHVEEPENGYFFETVFGYGFITAGNEWGCQRYIQHGIVIAGNDIGFPFGKILATADFHRAANHQQPYSHPATRDKNKPALSHGIGHKPRQHGR